MCDAICVGNNQQTFKKQWTVIYPISYVYSITEKSSDSFAAHFENHFNTTTSCTDLRKYITFKVIKQLNPIVATKIFTKANCNLCMQELLTILKKLRDKRVTIINKNSDIYGAFRHKRTFCRFCLSTDYPIFNE